MKSYSYIFFLIALFITVSCGKNEAEIVAYINHEVITVSELKHWMLLEKASVFSYFYRKYRAEDSKNFWTQKQGDEVPIEMLKERALEKAKRCKTQQILALEKGIIETASFDDIIKEMEEVNDNRRKKVDRGEPIYGPIQFTSRTYFSHVFDKMVLQLKDELSKHELKPNKEELLIMERENEQLVIDNPGFFIMHYVDKNYDAYIDKLMTGADFKINEAVYEKICLEK